MNAEIIFIGLYVLILVGGGVLIYKLALSLDRKPARFRKDATYETLEYQVGKALVFDAVTYVTGVLPGADIAGYETDDQEDDVIVYRGRRFRVSWKLEEL